MIKKIAKKTKEKVNKTNTMLLGLVLALIITNLPKEYSFLEDYLYLLEDGTVTTFVVLVVSSIKNWIFNKHQADKLR